MTTGSPAVFFDRDGVLIEDTGYPHLEEHLRITPGAVDAVAGLNRAGYLCIVVTNQSGVARGYFSEETMQAFNALLVRRFAAGGARLSAVYACPYHPDAKEERWRHPDHPDRKPNPGMILRAVAEQGVDASRSFLIGDQQSDLEAARRAGISGFRFEKGDLNEFVRRLLGH
jgi:D-glycero-D-manno-heptose 1,7-bisphosphate phosphatase